MRFDIKAIILAVLAGLVLFLPFVGSVHLFDWDEINFAESAREMIMSGDYLTVQINYEPFWEKPPLFIWMQVVSMKLFGINEFAARFPNAICGVFTLLMLFRVGRKLFDQRFGYLWMLVYTGSILPFFYFKSGLIDPWFNLFIFASITHFAYYFIYSKTRLGNVALSALYMGLAILTKGPVALLIMLLVFAVYIISQRFRIKTSFRDVLVFTLILAFVGGFWFILQILNGNFTIIQDFIVYQIRLFQTKDAGHGGFLLYHFVVMLIGVFPASVFALKYLVKRSGNSLEYNLYTKWMKYLFWVVLILFTIVRTKIVHYSSLAYLPLSFIAAVYAYKLLKGNKFVSMFSKVLILLIATVYALLIIAVSQIENIKQEVNLADYIKDDFALANINANVSWFGWEGLIGVFFLGGLIYFLFIARQNRLKINGVFAVTAVFTYATVLFITPKIEGYSQNAAIEFYESLAQEDVYVATLGYKSYAQHFYSKIEPSTNKMAADKDWLLKGDIDKPAYFVMKIHRKQRYLELYPQLEVLYEKNGFIFTKRVDR